MQNIQVVTALGKDERRGFVNAAPGTAHVTVSEVPVCNVLAVLDVQYSADEALRNGAMCPLKKWRVAQNVAYLQVGAGLFGSLC